MPSWGRGHNATVREQAWIMRSIRHAFRIHGLRVSRRPKRCIRSSLRRWFGRGQVEGENFREIKAGEKVDKLGWVVRAW
eukprot:1374257-Amorphochlora_amoeboformis.AAC.1